MWRVAGEQQQAGGEGGAELVEDGSQRVHGARTDPLSLSRTHVSRTYRGNLFRVVICRSGRKGKSLCCGAEGLEMLFC